jgi:hypothetical protein
MEELRRDRQYLELIINSIIVKEELFRLNEWSEELLKRVADTLAQN